MELGPLGMKPWGDVAEGPAEVDTTLDIGIPSRVLAQQGVPPDFAASSDLRYIHKQLGKTDIYFVANKLTNGTETVCTFRISGKVPELWWPDTGRIERATSYEMTKDGTKVPLRFDPSGSVFVVFRETAPGTPAPGGKNWLEFTHAQEISGPWEVTFDSKWGGPVQPVVFNQLEDWSKRTEEGVRYYSGTAVYRKTFSQNQKAESGKQQSRWYLDLGKVAVMAEVKLNDRDLGILWKPPYRVEVTDALKAGDNVLEIKAVNLWINRQIGDMQLPEDSDRKPNGTLNAWPAWLASGQPSPAGRYTFTSWRLWKKDDPLVESGLLGPVTIQTAK